jgi:cell division transport system permease protein
MSGYWTGHIGQRVYRWLFGRGRELPLQADGTALALCALLAVMVFLAALGITGSRVLGALTDDWSDAHTGGFTVEVRPLTSADTGKGGAQPPSLTTRVAAVLDVLKSTPDVVNAAPLGESEMRRLLGPWLGEDVNFQDLPLPVLVNAVLSPTADVSTLGELKIRLEESIPGVRVDDNGAWLQDMQGFVDTLRLVARLIVVLLATAAVLTVILVTRVGLLAHRDIVDILHIMGAHDSYLAWQFQTFVARIASIGSMGGALLAMAAIAVLATLGQALALPLLPAIDIDWTDYGLIALLPLPAILMAVLVARLSVFLWVRQQL